MNTGHSLFTHIVQGIRDICQVWAREMRSVFSDEGVLLFFIVLPLFYPLLYSWIYNNEVVHKVPVAVVDYSHSNDSRTFVRKVDASSGVSVAYYCNSLDEARSMVGHQKACGILYFPSDFGLKLQRGEQAHVGVYCDMSLMLTYKAILQVAQAVSMEMGSQIQVAGSNSVTARDEEITTSPLDIEEVPIFNATGGYGNAILPGVLMLILQQSLLLGIGLAAGTAREKNSWLDLAPVYRRRLGIFRIVTGKSMCYFMIYAVTSAYITLCVPRFFHFTALAQGGTLLALMIPYLLACIFFGMMLSCLVRYRENVMLLVVFTSVPLLFMTGISWPASNIPGVWKGVAMLFPSTFGVRGFLSINSMGGTLDDIRTEYIALWIQAVVYFVLACVVYRMQIVKSLSGKEVLPEPIDGETVISEATVENNSEICQR